MINYLMSLEKVLFEVPTDHTKVGVTIKPGPGDTRLFFFVNQECLCVLSIVVFSFVEKKLQKIVINMILYPHLK